MVRFVSFTCFVSRIRIYVVRDLRPSLYSLQYHHSLCTDYTHAINVSEKQDENFTVNYLINSCGLSSEGAVSASKWVSLQCPERADSVLAHFRNHGFSQTQIAQVVRTRPQLLNSDFEKIFLPKLDYLTSVGVSAEDLAKTVASTPQLLGHSLEKQIIPTYKLLTSMMPHKSVVAVLRSNSRIVMANHGTVLLPNIRLLREQGMPQPYISMSLRHFSRLVVLKHQTFAKLVGEAKEMRFNMKNSASLSAMSALWCKNTFNRSRQVLMMRWGWSEDDFLSAFRKSPASMIVSEKKLMQVMEFLVNKLGWHSVTIAKYPVVFSYSLEKRIIPRCSVIKVLLSEGLIDDSFSLQHVFKSEEQFLDMFVIKFVDQIPKLMSVYQGNVDIQDKMLN